MGYSGGKTILIPEKSAELAEFIGIMLGDGSSYYNKKSKNWQIRIVGHSDEQTYYAVYITELCKKLFGFTPHIRSRKEQNAIAVAMDRKQLGLFLASAGFPSGNKIERKARIPLWIRENKEYLVACIRGLIDTDGSVFRMSNKDPHLLRMSFTNYCPELMHDMREALTSLGYHPSKIILHRHIYLSRQRDIARYINEIGFANDKHCRRYHQFSPVV